MITLRELLTITDDVLCYENNEYVGWFDEFIDDVIEQKQKYLDYIVDHTWIGFVGDDMDFPHMYCELSNPEDYEGEGD